MTTSTRIPRSGCPPRTERRAPAARGRRHRVPALALAVVLAGCGGGDASADAAPPADGASEPVSAGSQEAMNTLTDAERAEGWRLLFDGTSLEQWRGYRMESMHDGWAARDGMLTRVGGGGDIITRDTFGDFELSLEWRVEEAGNSGVLYRGDESADYIYKTAPEMQVLDDAGHADGGDPLTSAGSVYGLYPAPRGLVRPAGEWNHARIVADGARVEHWLNGSLVAAYEQGSDEWNALVAGSKFVQWPEFGTLREGHIGLQDHGDPVWYRNIKIRPLG